MEKITFECPYCHHKWQSRSVLLMVGCPSCMKRFKPVGGNPNATTYNERSH